jgi:glycosyltransferase involved in cell wall biosynthesis
MALARQHHLDVLNIQYQAAAYDLHPAINFFPARLKYTPPLLRSRDRPAIAVTFHDLKVPYLFPKAGRLRDWVVTALARHADAAIVTNHADELTLTARHVGRVARIPIGSNITPVLPDDDPCCPPPAVRADASEGQYGRDAWRAARGMTPDHFVLGFFGFFNARKGIETLIRALAHLDDAYRLLFIGGTVGSSDATNRAYAERMSALIDQLNLTERVLYTGYVPAAEVSAAFAATDLCVLPYADGISFHHGTLMAALAHARPIVSTRPPLALPELVHGENVWLVPPNDPERLAAAITTLTQAPEHRQRLARGAATLATEFTWERIAARTAALFSTLTSTGTS